MVKKLIEGLYGFIFGFVGAFTQPVNDFLVNNIPNLDSYLSSVNSFLNSISSVISWFVYLIPKPFTATMLGLLFYVVGSLSGLLLMVYINGHILNFIKRLNIFGGK